MDAEQPNQPTVKRKPPSVFAQAFVTARQAELQTGRPRQLLSAGALGICLLFIASMLSLPRLDGALTVALYAFVIAMPLLVVDYFSASYKADIEPHNLMLSAFVVAGALVGDALGPVAVYAGVVAVVWHLNSIAGVILLLSPIGVLVVVVFVMLTGLFIYGWRRMRKESRNESPNSKPQPELSGD